MKSTPAATPMASGKSGTEQFGKGDLGIANYALTLEYLEADFYAQVANSGVLKGKLLDTPRRFGNEEQAARRRADRADQEGGRQARRRSRRRTFPLDNEKAILKLAATVENLGANAYLGQAGKSRTRRSSPPRCRSTPSRPATRRS